MAYYNYNSSYSGSDYYGENNFNSYPFNYNYSQVPSFMTYNNSYDYSQQSYAYDSSLYFSPNNNNNYHDHSYNNQTIAYSTTTFSDPKYLVYDPNYGMTQLVLSYSTLEFNEPAFDEYDPTPYGGGYDIDKTYGKPLSPSDQICYPRSGSIPTPTAIPVPTPIPVPVPIPITVPVEEAKLDEKVIIPQNVTNDQVAVEKPQLQDNTIKETSEAYKGEESEDSEDYSEENDDGDDYNSGSSYEGGFVENEIEKEVVVAAPPQYPSGYGLEAMDICESLFGYWPCLAKMKRENCCGVVHRGNNCEENMWKGTADYLFGNPYPYGGRRDDDYGGGELTYGYERY